MRLKRFHLRYRDNATFVNDCEILLPISRCRQVRRTLLKSQTSKNLPAPIIAIKSKHTTIFRFLGENGLEGDTCALSFGSRDDLEIQEGEEISLNIIYNQFIGYFLFLKTHPINWIRSTTRILYHICLGVVVTCLFSSVTYIFGIDIIHTKGSQAAFSIPWPVMLRLWKKIQKGRF
jgi:hypothetical protein